MSRYIKYEPLMAELERGVELADDWKTAHEIANVVKYAPSIDICFCRECKHRGICFGKLVQGIEVVQLNFCSYGQKERASDE